jgi:hypothetical protein
MKDRQKVLDALSGEGYQGEVSIKCPECGANESHIREVFTRLGTDPHEGGHAYQGTTGKGTTNERRDALVVVFDGECKHGWELVIQQHKGINMLRVTTVEGGQQNLIQTTPPGSETSRAVASRRPAETLSPSQLSDSKLDQSVMSGSSPHIAEPAEFAEPDPTLLARGA